MWHIEGSSCTPSTKEVVLADGVTGICPCVTNSDNPKHYRICKANENLRNFHAPVDIEGITGPQHGSFMRLTKKEYMQLQKWSASSK